MSDTFCYFFSPTFYQQPLNFSSRVFKFALKSFIMAFQKEGATIVAEHALVIGKKGKALLSKAQQTFNKLNKKIKKLHGQIKDFAAQYDDCLAWYSAEIYPVEQRSIVLRAEVAKLLYAVYCNDKSVSKKDRKAIKGVILQQIDDIFYSTADHDDELKKIFNAISGEDYNKIANEGFDDSKSEMEQMFSDMGLDIDMSNIGKDDDMPTIMRKIQEQMENAKANQEKEPPKQKKKTKRQQAQEAKEKELEEVRERSIKNIYRQLVKALHPDLERNEDLRIEKEALMKELTIAYKNNDLHTLLKLELNWIQHESDHLETLTDDKLNIYNQLLKEQVEDLEAELSVTGQHPRYAPLERFLVYGYVSKDALKAEPGQLKQIIASIESSIYNLKNGNVKQEIAEVVASYNYHFRNLR